MGSPKDDAAKKELDDLLEVQVKPLMERYKKVQPQLDKAHRKLDAAVDRHDTALIDFESRALRAFTVEIGDIVTSVNEVIGMLADFADNPDLAGSKDAAARWVHGLGAARKDLAHGVQKADHSLAKAERAFKETVKHGGLLEAAWASVRAKVASDVKMVEALGVAMEKCSTEARAAAKKLDGDALASQRKGASESDGMAPEWIQDAQSVLADFDKQLAQMQPSADFKTIYARERQRVDEQVADMRSAAQQLRQDYIAISLLQVQFNFVKIAEAMGIPLEEAKKLAPALSQNDSAKMKALDAVAKKHKLDGGGKDLLASLRKNGLVSRA
ncbi:MAG: hypothetical protein ABI520_03550 [Caldimonas sp.]